MSHKGEIVSVQLIKHIVFIIDTSLNLITADIPKISRFVQLVSHEIWQATPLTRISIAQLNQSKCFLETRFTQDINELMRFFINDGINQQGTIQLSTALLLLHQLSFEYSNLQAIYINFSPLTFDSEQNLSLNVSENGSTTETNLLQLVEILRQNNIGFNAVSVKTDIFILSHICERLQGYHMSVQSLESIDRQLIDSINMKTSSNINIQKQNIKWRQINVDQNKFILVTPAVRLYQTSICQCCGELKQELWQCLNCKALNCNLTFCCICGLMLITRDTVLKTQMLIKRKQQDIFYLVKTQFKGKEKKVTNITAEQDVMYIKSEEINQIQQNELQKPQSNNQNSSQQCHGCEQLIQDNMFSCKRCASVYCEECTQMLNTLGFCLNCQK